MKIQNLFFILQLSTLPTLNGCENKTQSLCSAYGIKEHELDQLPKEMQALIVKELIEKYPEAFTHISISTPSHILKQDRIESIGGSSHIALINPEDIEVYSGIKKNTQDQIQTPTGKCD